ncbi:MAG: DUF4097 family beta strand repeat-containing protein [Thermoanaerobaculia bacterium]
MNSRRQAVYSLAAILLATSCGSQMERRTVRIERQWPAQTIRRIEVREIDGAITVDAGSANSISLNAQVRSDKEPAAKAENQGFFMTQIEGDTLVIGRRREHNTVVFGFWGRNDTRVDYALHVPANVEVDLHTVTGRITTHGVAGETRATTVNGVVDIESPGSSEVEAKAVNGRIEARFLNEFHGASLKTVNGGVNLVLPASASFAGDFSQVNGDVEAAFPLNIRSHPGSRRVSGEVNGGKYALRITTVNGDIRIENGGEAPALQAPPAPLAPSAPSAITAPPAPPARPDPPPVT